MLNITLSHSPNPDIKGGYWEPPKDPKHQVVKVSSLLEAREACMDFIEHNGLGGSNFTGGKVTDEKNIHFANISYNGRIWNVDYTKEMKVSKKCQ